MKFFAPILLICGLLAVGCKSDGSGVSSITGKSTKKVASISNEKITFEDGSTKELDPGKSNIFLIPNAEYIKSEAEPIETVG